MSCHKCEGNSCASSTTSSYCLKHDPQDKCATAFKSDGSVEQKGCYSEFSTALKATCDLTTNINCRTCNIKDCNEAINTRDNNYCYKCVGPDCLEPESQVLCLGGDGKSSECYSDIDSKFTFNIFL